MQWYLDELDPDFRSQNQFCHRSYDRTAPHSFPIGKESTTTLKHPRFQLTWMSSPLWIPLLLETTPGHYTPDPSRLCDTTKLIRNRTRSMVMHDERNYSMLAVFCIGAIITKFPFWVMTQESRKRQILEWIV